MASENEEDMPMGKLVEWNAIAFTEREGRRYVGVSGTDERGHHGHIVLDFDDGTLLYEHAFWMIGAYAYEKDVHHEYKRKRAQLNAEISKNYFGDDGIDTLLRHDLQKSGNLV